MPAAYCVVTSQYDEPPDVTHWLVTLSSGPSTVTEPPKPRKTLLAVPPEATVILTADKWLVLPQTSTPRNALAWESAPHCR